MKDSEVRRRVREQVASALQQDLEGGEAIMKEVWEEIEGDEQEDLANAELRSIIRWLRSK